MKWVVKSTLVCPQTGTAFSCILSLKNLQLIVNTHYSETNVFRIQPYNREMWKTLQSNLRYPRNGTIKPKICNYFSICLFH